MAFKPDRLFFGFEPRHRPFTGRLKAPIIYSDTASAFRERKEKLELLLEHYSVNTLPEAKRWKALAYALACDLVPGMHVLERAPSKRGRPPTKEWKNWSVSKRLVGVIDSIKLERKKGTRDAARIAIQRYPKAWPGIDADSLAARYYEARNLLSDVEALLSDVKPKRP